MTLYTVTQPDPPAGTDFTFIVPGRYMYDVTGITAILNTGGTPGTVCVDSSGNGLDGTYDTPGPPATFVPGLIPGDSALEVSAPAGAPTAGASLPFAGVQWLSPFTISAVVEPDPAVLTAGVIYTAYDATGAEGLELRFQFVGPDWQVQLNWAFGGWSSPGNAIPNDGLPHRVYVTFQPPGTALCFVDGAAVLFTKFGIDPPQALVWSEAHIAEEFGLVFTGNGIAQCVATFPAVLGPGAVALIDAAAVDVPTYSAAILAETPSSYYLLDGAGPSTGRQPSLIVTNGTTELEAIPTGFPAVSTPGPYEYSWQPQLNADVQSTDGTLTTVAIPRLLLPAGYTVGVRTLDLQPGDQWSNVALWWDDAYQNAFDPLNDYLFPGGIKLVYQQTGAP